MLRNSLALGEAGVVDAIDVFRRIGTELSHTAASVKRLQVCLAPLLDTTDGLQPEVMREIQDLDHVEQVLRCLSVLIGDLHADSAPIDSILARIPLAGLAARLRGEPEVLVESGEFDLF